MQAKNLIKNPGVSDCVCMLWVCVCMDACVCVCMCMYVCTEQVINAFMAK